MVGILKIGIRIRFLSSLAVFFCCSLFMASVCFGDPYKVIRVYSGDTIKVEDPNSIVKIRLAGIDAPETDVDIDAPGQPFSEESRVYLSELLFRKTVDVVSYGYDIENRIIGVVFLEGKNVNLEMIGAGLAEVYPGKTPPGFDIMPFRQAEKTARMAEKGIWSLGEKYVSPSKWRKQHRTPKRLADLPALKEIAPETVGKKIATRSETPKDPTGEKPPDKPEDTRTAALEKSAEPSPGPEIHQEPKTIVTGIDVEVGKTSEKVLVHLKGFSVPKAFDIDGENPRIVIDIWNVSTWNGPSRLPSKGKVIRRIRTYLHKNENKLRIVLDLNVNPYRDYSITQLYDVKKNTYWLEIQ